MKALASGDKLRTSGFFHAHPHPRRDFGKMRSGMTYPIHCYHCGG